MFGIFFVSYLLECLILMPVSYTLLQITLAPNLSILISGLFAIIALLVCWINKFSVKSYLYKIITVLFSLLYAFALTRISIATVLIFFMCIFIFARVRIAAVSQRDDGTQVALIGLFLNALMAFINIFASNGEFIKYSNAAIFISTIASVILLIMKQVDESRRFGQNDMGISTAQRKNNRIFGAATIVTLLVLGSIGGISNIYNTVLNIFKKFFEILGYLFRMQKTEQNQTPNSLPQDIFGGAAEEPSLFAVIIEIILYAIAAIIAAAILGFAVYYLAKLIINISKRLINWLKNKEQVSLRYSENGYIDEKQRLYNKNIKKIANSIGSAAKVLFNRETPYNKLPDNKAKIRRLFKIFINKAKKEGLSIKNSSTAKEICKNLSDNSPGSEQFNTLMSKCYNEARYGDLPPESGELETLESGLLK